MGGLVWCAIHAEWRLGSGGVKQILRAVRMELSAGRVVKDFGSSLCRNLREEFANTVARRRLPLLLLLLLLILCSVLVLLLPLAILLRIGRRICWNTESSPASAVLHHCGAADTMSANTTIRSMKTEHKFHVVKVAAARSMYTMRLYRAAALSTLPDGESCIPTRPNPHSILNPGRASGLVT